MPISKGTTGIYRFLLHIAQLFIYTITANILLSEIAFIFGRAISWYTLPLSFLAGLLCMLYFYGDEPGRSVIYEIVIAILLFLFLTGMCGKLFDFSYDGNAYHKMAIGLLKNHWNPIKQLPEEVTAEVLRIGSVGNIWVECYAKGAWIFAAGVYGITGNIECGKVYTLISTVCAFLLTYYCMRSCYKKGKVFALMFSTVAALNPVALEQMNSFYVDGYLHIMLYILILSLIMMSNREVNGTEKLIFVSIMACAMVICGTIKFTGLLYGGIYCIVYFLYYCYCQLRLKDLNRWRNIRKCFCLFVLLAAVTVFWAGADCYVINTIRHGSPVYPLYGNGAVDIMTVNSSFGEVNRVKNLLISLFSKVDSPIFSLGEAPQLKIPFTVDWSSEIFLSHAYDCRISGFGVFFSGILIIAMMSIIVKAVNMVVRQKTAKTAFEIPFLGAILVANIGLCLAITESWWARYAPYIYFTVLIGVFLFWDSNFEAGKQRVKKCVSVLLFVLLLSNNYLCRTRENFLRSAKAREEIRGLKVYTEIEVDTANFRGVYFNLMDQNVYYTSNPNLIETGMGEPLFYMGIQVLPK